MSFILLIFRKWPYFVLYFEQKKTTLTTHSQLKFYLSSTHERSLKQSMFRPFEDKHYILSVYQQYKVVKTTGSVDVK